MKFQHGFTLIEIVVSVGIIAFISIIIAQAFFTTTRVNTKTELINDIKQNGDFALDRIIRALRPAQQVTSVCDASPGSTSSILSIRNADNTTSTFTSILDGTVLRLVQNPGTNYLTSTNVTLSDTACTGFPALQFVCISSAAQPPRVEIIIRFCLSQKGTPQASFEKAGQAFQTTVTLRN